MAEDLLHFAGFKIRVNGDGELLPTLIGFDEIQTQSLTNITMSTVPGREPTILSNFISQRAILRLETVDQEEYFIINRLVIYVKTLWKSFQQ